MKRTITGLLQSELADPQTHVPVIQSAHAILLLSENYVLQLRDNKPTIAAAGQWALFGGMRKPDETPLQAIKREVYEELLIHPSEYHYLWFLDYFSDFDKEVIRTWFFVSDVTSVWVNHQLREGQAVRTFGFEQTTSLEMPPVMCHAIERFHKQAESIGHSAESIGQRDGEV